MSIDNSFTSLFYRFLHSNAYPGHVQLHITEGKNFTDVRYDSDDKYHQNMDFICSLPYTKYSGYDAEQLWQLLDAHGLSREGLSISLTDMPANLSPEQRLTWCANYRMRAGLPVRGRRAELSGDEENDLYLYLQAQIKTVSPLPQTGLNEYTHLQQVYRLANELVERWNNRNEAELEEQFSRELWTEPNPFDNARDNPTLWPQIQPYTFCDGISAGGINEATFRPFSFAGVIFQVPECADAPIAVQLAFRDARYPKATTDAAYREQVTAQYCREYNYDRLALSPGYRDWVVKNGQANQKRPGIYALAAERLPGVPEFRHP